MSYQDYSDQANNNQASFLSDLQYKERKDVFITLAKAFTNAGVNWTVGCSLSLFFRGIVDDFHDIDLIVSLRDIDIIDEIMENYGAELVDNTGNGYCESDKYRHYYLGRADIDIIAGFRVNTFNTWYHYELSTNDVDTIDLIDIEIPLLALEVMYILYYMMEGWQPKRRFKRQLIERYFYVMSPIHRKVLTDALTEYSLPPSIKFAIKRVLKV